MSARYRMEIEIVHHALSGWGGEPEVKPVEDPDGDWVEFALAQKTSWFSMGVGALLGFLVGLML